MPLPLDWKPDRGSADSYVRVREQARISSRPGKQVSGKFELLPVEAWLRADAPSRTIRRRHLSSTSKAIPSSASTASNICSAMCSRIENGALPIEGNWAFTRADEKQAFETFVDFVMARWAQFPELAHLPLRPLRAGGLEAPDGPLRDARGRDRPNAARRVVCRSLSGRSARAARQRRELLDQAAWSRSTASSARPPSLMRMSRSPNFQANLELDDVASISDEYEGRGACLQQG